VRRRNKKDVIIPARYGGKNIKDIIIFTTIELCPSICDLAFYSMLPSRATVPVCSRQRRWKIGSIAPHRSNLSGQPGPALLQGAKTFFKNLVSRADPRQLC
jgi:hypothetical protein